MMRYLYGYLLFLFPVVVFGQDFRNVALGATCADAVLAEQELKSVPIGNVDERISEGLLIFQTVYDGFSAVSSYFCQEDVVFGQIFWVEALSKSEAEEIYASLRADLLGLYGMPCRDRRNLPFWTQVSWWIRSGFSGVFLDGVDWIVSSNSVATLSIREVGSGPAHWTISVVVSEDGPPIKGKFPDETEVVIDTSVADLKCIPQ